MRGPPGWWWLVVHPTGEGIACQARHGVDACSTNSLPRKRLRKPLLLRVEGLEVTRPDQVWVADILFVRLREEFVSLAIVMDVFPRRVRGWAPGRSPDQGLTLAALRRAIRQGRRPEVHDSDQGV